MTEENAGQKKNWLKPLTLGLIGMVVVVFVAVAAWRTFAPNPDVWTNDALTVADYTTVAPRVVGQITEVLVDDHQVVRRGDPLVNLDPKPLQAKVSAAKAQADSALAQIAVTDAALAVLPVQIDQAQATVEKDAANTEFSRRSAERYEILVKDGGAVTESSAEKEIASARSAEAQQKADEAALGIIKMQEQVLEAQKKNDEAMLKMAKANLDDAKLNLIFTRIEAPIDGVVGARAARPGDYVDPGTALMAIVPLQSLYIVANYRETELTDVVRGQSVSIIIDAFPDLSLNGRVDSIAPATGVTFSPIAPDNATGNFTKVVQRLAVKIVFNPDQKGMEKIKQGMSVETTIHTRSYQESP